ncbi:hypothetical protein L798_07291 [Zootermopsis nevadensis]|uniref:Uncharacterized protein n=1 Tax=Zootermopsis nevadensis TaxID=136037 RepID=A0A067R6D4_ZOONE|nr:hypothetical protein L798_07291 [Zootermopsis nevadensis]
MTGSLQSIIYKQNSIPSKLGLFAVTSRMTLDPTQCHSIGTSVLTSRIKQLACKEDHLPSSTAEGVI